MQEAAQMWQCHCRTVGAHSFHSGSALEVLKNLTFSSSNSVLDTGL